eukprot:4744746-Pyramimonas_sp.AAC.1
MPPLPLTTLPPSSAQQSRHYARPSPFPGPLAQLGSWWRPTDAEESGPGAPQPSGPRWKGHRSTANTMGAMS